MNIENIELFCKVYEAGNIARAAEENYISHQAVSKRIRAIESELGAKLFTRSTRGIEPTPAGEDAYRTFKSINASYRDLAARIARTGEAPVIRVAVEFYDTDFVNIDALLRLGKLLPGNQTMTVSYLSNGDCYRLLTEGQIDAAFTNKPAADQTRYEFHPLDKSRSCLAVASDSPLASKKRLETNDFAGQTFLGIIDAESTNRIVLSHFAREGVKLRTENIAYDMRTLASHIRNGRGFHVMPENYETPLANEPGISIRPLPRSWDIFEIGIILSSTLPHTPGIDAMLELIGQNRQAILRKKPRREGESTSPAE